MTSKQDEVTEVLAKWLAHYSGLDPEEIDPATGKPCWQSYNPEKMVQFISEHGLKITKADEWQDISTAKEDAEPVLLLLAEGDIVDGHWEPKEEDGMDSMGCDAGWHDNVCATFPSRSFGNPKYFSEAINPPTHWQPRPEDPQE